MSGLPKGWVEATVGDTGQYINGFAFKPAHWGTVGRPIIRIQNLTDPEKLGNRTELEVPDDLVVNPGDLLVSWSATLDAFIWRGEQAVLNQHIFRVVPDERIVGRRYLYYLLKQLISEMLKTEHLHGSTMKHINRGPFMAHRAPIAPRAEQERIVDEIEKQFTRLDAARAALKRVQANLKRYRASVLKAACEGRLVHTEAELARKEGRDYEPADQLLQRILRERRARWEADTLAKMIASGKPPKDHGWKQKYKEPARPNTTNLPSLPEGWCWVSLDQISTLVRNGISIKPEGETGVPILRISAVRPLQVDLNDVRFLPDRDEWGAYALNTGDLLFTRYNGSRDFVGVCGMVGPLTERTVHPDKLIRVVLYSDDVAAYIEVVGNSGASRSFMESRIRTTAGQSGISGEDVRNLPIPFCPAGEQLRIASEVARRITTVSATQAQVVSNSLRAEKLRRAILEEAYSGMLIPQDPADEPASALLERIRSEGVEDPKPPVRRKHQEPVHA